MAPPVDASPTAANAKLNRKVIAISIGAALGAFCSASTPLWSTARWMPFKRASR